ncbi:MULTISPECIES: AraC family transcriptional regulator [unclassified Desulfovibrio]|uniref:AraC family transcriptional regulator n=1 Tax=unclassified Desulfovibrio TaxID=2593640 RepID=UPI0013EC82DB|nr:MULTISPECIES: AraC family transcriptional regulator [unclassified Desulfovibrio]
MPAETTVLAHDVDMGADAFSFSLTGRAFAPHFHPAWVLGCVLSGRRTLMVQGRPYHAGPGDVVIFRPGEVHACAPAGSAPFVWRGFHFRPGSAGAEQVRLLTEARDAGPVFPAGDLLDELLAAHALMGGRASPSQKEARLSQALHRLGAGLTPRKRHSPPQPPRPAEPGLEALRVHLESHAPERFSLEDMAGMARMGKFRLLRAFARLTGATPYRYLESARVNRAQELLERGLAPAEAALAAGFSDQSHLARAFRARLGVTPGACRRRP